MFENEQLVETKQCKNCDKNFEITDKDKEFYEKVSPVFNGEKYYIPTPTFCPDCRQQRRLAFRNEKKLYKRECQLCGKGVVSIYSKEKPYKIYCNKCYISDSWDPMKYGKDFDFNKSFFEQFRELFSNVPKENMPGTSDTNVNSDYTVGSADCRNCYLTSNAYKSVDTYYSNSTTDIENVVDSFNVSRSANIWQCMECNNSYNLYGSINCENCKDSLYLEDCKNCKNCIACIGLMDKSFCIFNEQYTEEEYHKKLNELELDSYKGVNKLKEKFDSFKQQYPRKYAQIDAYSENCSGNNITNSINCKNCYNIVGNENTFNCMNSQNTNNSADISFGGYNADLVYEIANSGLNLYKNAFNVFSFSYSNSYYNFDIQGCSNCFGCVT